MKLQGWAVAGKAWTALAGSILTLVIPWIVQASAAMPPPWPAVIGGIVAVLTALGVYRAPYAPAPQKNSPSPSPWPTA